MQAGFYHASTMRMFACACVLNQYKQYLGCFTVTLTIMHALHETMLNENLRRKQRFIECYLLTGNAFSASALFYLGLSMVGKVQNQIGVALVVPILLIFAKS